MTNTFIYGCMGSEKTLELIRLIKMDMNQGRKVMCFKPAQDNRSVNGSGEDRSFISSRAGMSVPAELKSAEEIVQYINNNPEIKTFGISEIHLFGSNGAAFIDLVKKYEKNHEKRLVLDGLVKDYRGESFPFGDSGRFISEIMPFCRNIEKEGLCFYWPKGSTEACGRPAYHTQRLFDGLPAPKDSPLLEVGGNRGRTVVYKGRQVIVTYKGVCDKHHFVGSEGELEEIVKSGELNFPQPIENLERPIDSGLAGIYKDRSQPTVA